ncbi:MarR family winged helix-turn-helix transcriptional regulator [Anaeromicropila populeti]|uniref:DNA-binding transcriptional regulator, MarR family n=1 Tax=Anaeromicropila populeti TaxID=37658 RepID=A0A1I6IPD7_9FIRM|nr:MarR family winged helix-turn-helix transcriptional regulator [Anaeromicropila populeti]SFR68100.1 DNA-binding transcriptional regulator, MarR family [Anaeromicropila populeti]
MDYKALAQEYMEVMYQMRRQNTQKHINESLHGESFVLFYISKHDGHVIPSDISNEMGITSARIAATLNSLERKGLISRRIDIEDRRRILIDLTDEGRVQADKQYEMIMNMTTNLLHYLGEEDSVNFIRIMKKLSEKSPEDFM